MATARFALLCAAISLLASPLAQAHHGSAAYDHTKTLKLEATITDFKFINPHAQIFFDVVETPGHVTHWACEVDDPAAMERNGWKRDSLKPGDHVTIFGHGAKNGAPVMVLVKVVFANGKELAARV